MTVRLQIKDGRLVFPDRPLTAEELDAAEALIAERPELRPEPYDFTQHWTAFERQAVAWFQDELQKMFNRKDSDAAARP